MTKQAQLIGLFFLITGRLCAQEAITVIPETKFSQLIFSHKDAGDKPYLAFPAVLQLSPEEILVTLKRGTSHGNDKQADCDLLRINTLTNSPAEHQTIGSIPDRKFQLTVPVRLDNGDIQFYTDLQHTGLDGRHYRNGMRFSTSTDGGKTVGPWQTLPLIDGVEYGYPFDFIVEGKTVYMLAMSFGYRPGERWSVAVLKSEDGAKSWKFVCDISQALGNIAINESSFVRTKQGFIVVVRGYGAQATQIARFDHQFNLLDTRDLTGTGPLANLIGWPRVFMKDGVPYVLGRIYQAKDSRMQLGLLRINEPDLSIEKIIILDNEDGQLPVRDGYYAGQYWTEKADNTWFNVITYRSVGGATYPDIIRLSFPWDEIK